MALTTGCDGTHKRLMELKQGILELTTECTETQQGVLELTTGYDGTHKGCNVTHNGV